MAQNHMGCYNKVGHSGTHCYEKKWLTLELGQKTDSQPQFSLGSVELSGVYMCLLTPMWPGGLGMFPAFLCSPCEIRTVSLPPPDPTQTSKGQAKPAARVCSAIDIVSGLRNSGALEKGQRKPLHLWCQGDKVRM